jgi:hypothetical protein
LGAIATIVVDVILAVVATIVIVAFMIVVITMVAGGIHGCGW